MAPRGDFPSSKQDQYIVRLPDGMRDEIKVAAKANGRSMNAEIVARLSESFGSHRTIRDDFAMAALSGYLARGESDEHPYEAIAEWAFDAADAMLTWRRELPR